MDTDVSYTVGGAELLDEVAPLWYELVKQQSPLSETFGEFLSKVEWSRTKTRLTDKSTVGKLRIEMVRQNVENVGYCISSIDKANVGEIDSLFLIESLRSQGIGTGLMRRALEWLDGNAVRAITVRVLFGNERVNPFYAQFGFAPFSYILRRK